jgi:hypothetical protein
MPCQTLWGTSGRRYLPTALYLRYHHLIFKLFCRGYHRLRWAYGSVRHGQDTQSKSPQDMDSLVKKWHWPINEYEQAKPADST